MAQQLARRKDDLVELQDPAGQIITREKVGSWLERVKAGMSSFVTKQKDLGKKITSIKITDQKTFDAANNLYRSIADNEKDGIEVIGPLVEIANTLHKGLTSERKACQDLALANRNALAAKLKEYEDECQRRQRIIDQGNERKAQAEADRIKREREKNEREAKAKADKAEAEAREKRRIADDAKAKADRETAEAQRLADEAAKNAKDKEEREAAAALQHQADEIARIAEKETGKLERDAEKAETKHDTASTNLEFASAVREEPVIVEARQSAPLLDRSAAAVDWVDKWTGVCDEPLVTICYIIGVPLGHKIAHPELLHLISINQDELDIMGKAQKAALSIAGCRPLNTPFKRAKHG